MSLSSILQALENKARGAFFGALVGDALGAPVEFKERGTFPWVTHMLPCDHFGLKAGSYTDDGSLMLCLAASLVNADGEHDALTALTHYAKWYREGYMSVNGRCFDVGNTTARALTDFIRHGTLRSCQDGEWTAGNGAIMRIAPVPIVCHNDVEAAWDMGEASSLTTHAAPAAVWGAGFVAALTALALQGRSKREMLEWMDSLQAVPDAWCRVVRDRVFLHVDRHGVRARGYIVATVEAVLWAFFATETFEKGLEAVVNLGEDADTAGAVFGTIAGAFYGERNIPTRWLDALQTRVRLEGVWADLWSLVSGRLVLDAYRTTK